MIWMTKNGRSLKPAIYEFSTELDRETAQAKLETIDIKDYKWTSEMEVCTERT